MSRAVRTARGAFGAFAATLLAAASHSLAGGVVTPLAVIATTLFALPLCVLLAGKTGSLWRLSLAVLTSQFLYHWSFSGLGAAQLGASGATAEPVSPHAAHLGLAVPLSFTPETASVDAAGIWMWAAHGLASVLTIALIHRGERAVLRLVHTLRSAVPVHVPTAVRLPARPAILEFFTALPSQAEQVFLSAISHRGPPRSLAPAL